MRAMTGVLPAKRPFSAVVMDSFSSTSRRRICRFPTNQSGLGLPAFTSFQDSSHVLFYGSTAYKARRRSFRRRGRCSREPVSRALCRPQTLCRSTSAPGLDFLAELAEEMAIGVTEEKKAESSSSSSSSSSEDEDIEMKVARKRQKKEMKAYKKLHKAQEMQQDRIAQRAAFDEMQCSDPVAPDSPAAMEISSGAADSTLLVHTFQGEPVVVRMPGSGSALPASDESAQTKSQLLVCQGSACRKRGSGALLGTLEAASEGLQMDVAACKCLGMCKTGPHIRAVMATPGHTSAHENDASMGLP